MDASKAEPLSGTPESTAAARPRRRTDVIARRLPDRTVLLDGSTGSCFEINSVGSLIWERLDGLRSWNEIAEDMESLFGLSRAQAAQDVAEFAKALRRADLLRF